MLTEERKKELLEQKTFTIKEVSELFEINPSSIYKKLEKYPDCLNLEGNPIRIKNDNKLKKFNPDLRVNRKGYHRL